MGKNLVFVMKKLFICSYIIVATPLSNNGTKHLFLYLEGLLLFCVLSFHLRSITNFWSGWESLLRSIKNSIANGGTKHLFLYLEGLLSHSPKGNLPMPYLKSVLDVYDIVLRNPTACGDVATNKVKQEIIHGLGEVYVYAQGMFESSMYSQLLSIIDSAIREAKTSQNNFEAEFRDEAKLLTEDWEGAVADIKSAAKNLLGFV
ncbi:uncharacterized protein LOC143541257 isoform X2 [Bidens hawaiensis]